MDPASRNRVLTVGGALIVVALLLVCGPLEGRLGKKGPVETAPSVASAPPEVAMPAVEEPEIVALPVLPVTDESEDKGAVGEGASVVAAAPVVPLAGVAADDHDADVAKAPPVSAGPPPVAVVPVVAGPSAAELAQNAFDSSSGDAAPTSLLDRFAPPVDSGPGTSTLALALDQGFGAGGASMLRACDTPGGGCRNSLSSGGPVNIPAGIPPIASGPRVPRVR
jgi:hypothetical protein